VVSLAPSGNKDSKQTTYMRITGLVFCVDKQEFNWTSDHGQVKDSVKRVVVHSEGTGYHSYSEAALTNEGVLVVMAERSYDKSGGESYLIVEHNCTDSGETQKERFNMTLFSAAEQPLQPYTLLAQGYAFLPVSSHDTEFNRKFVEMSAVSSYYSRWEKKSVPKMLFVEYDSGGLFGSYWEAGRQRNDYRVVGRLYNWDYESMPQPNNHLGEELLNASVPLHFEGRVTVTMRGNGTCNGVKLALYNGERKIMSGSTHSADGPFEMYAERGGFIELIEQRLAEWQLVVEDTCNSEWSLHSQKFRLNSKGLGEKKEYFKAAELKLV